MIRITAIATSILLSAVCISAHADELDDNWTFCQQNMPAGFLDPPRPGPVHIFTWKKGFEQCQPVYNAWAKRERENAVSDEAANPDLKKMHDFAKTLVPPTVVAPAPTIPQ